MVMPARPRNGPGKTKPRAKSYRFSRLPGLPRGAPLKMPVLDCKKGTDSLTVAAR
jgi:hypothetical protein